MSKEILDAIWFSNGSGCIGIVKVRSYDEIKFYISSVPGLSEDADKHYVADYGSRFPHAAGMELLGGEVL